MIDKSSKMEQWMWENAWVERPQNPDKGKDVIVHIGSWKVNFAKGTILSLGKKMVDVMDASDEEVISSLLLDRWFMSDARKVYEKMERASD